MFKMANVVILTNKRQNMILQYSSLIRLFLDFKLNQEFISSDVDIRGR